MGAPALVCAFPMKIPTFLSCAVITLVMAGAGPASAVVVEPPTLPAPAVSAPTGDATATGVAVATGALSLLAPADALLHAVAALGGVLAESGLLPDPEQVADIACPVPDRIEVVDNFGEWRGSHRHSGVDIRASHGSPVRAVLDATIASVGYDGAYGLTVTMRDRSGDIWLYAHLSSASVHVGEAVRPGRMLGAVGCTGRCSGSHLHLERRPGGGAPVDTYDRLVRACGRRA
jgi:murein DD-endopeptidase MepM/ murein hydrolase activator NlpD